MAKSNTPTFIFASLLVYFTRIKMMKEKKIPTRAVSRADIPPDPAESGKGEVVDIEEDTEGATLECP